MPDIAPHDWFRPRLSALVAEAEADGIARDVAIAVITDIVNSAPLSVGPTESDDDWNKDIGEPEEFVNVNNPLSSQPSLGDEVPNPLDRVGGRNNVV
jgi:hypothetical protein